MLIFTSATHYESVKTKHLLILPVWHIKNQHEWNISLFLPVRHMKNQHEWNISLFLPVRHIKNQHEWNSSLFLPVRHIKNQHEWNIYSFLPVRHIKNQSKRDISSIWPHVTCKQGNIIYLPLPNMLMSIISLKALLKKILFNTFLNT